MVNDKDNDDDEWTDLDEAENSNLVKNDDGNENDENFIDYVTNNYSIIDNWELDVAINDSDVNSLHKEKIYLLMKKCRSLINITKKSAILLNYFNQLRTKWNVKRGIGGDCITRWNSTFVMIDSLISLKSLIIKFFDDKYRMHLRRDVITKLISIELENDDWQLMIDISTVLKPFFLATKLMSARSYPTIGLCYYTLKKLYAFLLNDETDPIQMKTLKRMLLIKFQKYFISDHEQLKLLKVNIMAKQTCLLVEPTLRFCMIYSVCF